MQNGVPSDGTASVRSVERAIDIASYLAAQDGTTSLSELSQQLGLSKGTVHRLLACLQAKGLVDKDEYSRYMIGPLAIKWSRPLLHRGALASLVLPLLRKLRDEAGETVSFHTRVGVHQVALEQAESRSELRRTLELGKMVPLGLGATGKVMLAFLPEADRQEVFRLLQDYGISAARLQALEEELDRVKQRGVAFSAGELVPGGAAVSAPVFGSSGKVTGALALSGPANRLRIKVLESHVERVKEIAARISNEVG